MPGLQKSGSHMGALCSRGQGCPSAGGQNRCDHFALAQRTFLCHCPAHDLSVSLFGNLALQRRETNIIPCSVKDGEFRQYRGARDGDALLYFVKKQQWQSIEPLSAWKKPDTIHMSILSYFFKLSHTLKVRSPSWLIASVHCMRQKRKLIGGVSPLTRRLPRIPIR